MLFPGADLPALAAIPFMPVERVERIHPPFSAGSAEALFSHAADSVSEAPALMFAHGNGELITHNLSVARKLADLGLAVLLAGYPGYGRSDGTPSRRAITEAFLSGFDWLHALVQVDQGSIGGFGCSLGAAALADLAQARSLKALILQSPF